jgi:serine/threonine-protein kinase
MFAQQPVSFGRYELVYRLGQGGMGEVHLARLTGAAGFEKLYVLKTILPQMSGDPQFVQRFQHEGRLLVHLQHSNIAQVYDMGEVDGTFFMAVEYVPGVDLSRVLGRARQLNAQMPIPIALYVGQQMAEALGYAHRKTGAEGESLGIVHRDISPHNVMVSYEGEVKVIDFGLAKSSAGSAQTLPSTVMGKLGYMSPEQARAEKVDARSDIYSAGVVLWEMLAGRRLFDSESVGQMIAAMAHPVIPSLRSIRPDISPSLEKVVHRALTPATADRYARAEELARALNEELVREGKQAGAEETGTYLRALCPEEFAEQRRLVSTLARRMAAPAEGLEGTLVRDGAAQAQPGGYSRTGVPGHGPQQPGSGGVQAPMGGGMTGAYGSGRVPAPQGSGGMPPAYVSGGPQGGYGSGGVPQGGMPVHPGSGGMPQGYGSGGMQVPPGSGGMPQAAYGSGGMQVPPGSGGMPQAAYGSGGMQVPPGSGGMPQAYGSGPQAVPPQRSRTPLLALGAVCLLLAGALGAVLLTRGGGNTPQPPAPVAAPVARNETPPAPPPPEPVKAEPPPAEPPPAEPPPAYARVTVDGKVYEVMEDRGEHYLRAGRADGIVMGTEVQMVGPPESDGRRPLYGVAVVMELKGERLARLRPDKSPPAGSTLFASFTPEPKAKDKPRPSRREPARTPSPTAPATPPPPVVAEPEPEPLRGKAELSGFGPVRRVIVYNREQRPWTKCELRLPNNKRYLLDKLDAGDQNAIAMVKFRQDGVERDLELKSLTVTCAEGTARFKMRD